MSDLNRKRTRSDDLSTTLNNSKTTTTNHLRVIRKDKIMWPLKDKSYECKGFFLKTNEGVTLYQKFFYSKKGCLDFGSDLAKKIIASVKTQVFYYNWTKFERVRILGDKLVGMNIFGGNTGVGLYTSKSYYGTEDQMIALVEEKNATITHYPNIKFQTTMASIINKIYQLGELGEHGGYEKDGVKIHKGKYSTKLYVEDNLIIDAGWNDCYKGLKDPDYLVLNCWKRVGDWDNKIVDIVNDLFSTEYIVPNQKRAIVQAEVEAYKTKDGIKSKQRLMEWA